MHTSQRLVKNVLLQMDAMGPIEKLRVFAYVFGVYYRRNGLAAAIKQLFRGA